MATREPPLHKRVATFVVHHVGKRAFAPHTGQDYAAWIAFVYLLDTYCKGDDAGRRAAIASMRALLSGGIQRDRDDIAVTFQKAIPAVLDWSDEDRIWNAVRPTPGAPPPGARYSITWPDGTCEQVTYSEALARACDQHAHLVERLHVGQRIRVVSTADLLINVERLS